MTADENKGVVVQQRLKKWTAKIVLGVTEFLESPTLGTAVPEGEPSNGLPFWSFLLVWILVFLPCGIIGFLYPQSSFSKLLICTFLGGTTTFVFAAIQQVITLIACLIASPFLLIGVILYVITFPLRRVASKITDKYKVIRKWAESTSQPDLKFSRRE